MSGHSKWHRIKHKKAATDAKRGKSFGHLARMIRLAARNGTDPTTNHELRDAIERAKKLNLPQVNINRLLNKDSRELIDITYEGFGPGGIAIMIFVATNNTNRTVSEIRAIIKKHGGSLGERGSVSWKFKQRAVLMTQVNENQRDRFELAAIEAGALDTTINDNKLTIIGAPKLQALLTAAMTRVGATDIQADVTYYVPINQRVTVSQTDQIILTELSNDLYAHDDVLEIYTDIQEN